MTRKITWLYRTIEDELHVMGAAIDAVDDQVNPLAHLVSCQVLGQDPAGDLLA